jgi:hypothetical protein
MASRSFGSERPHKSHLVTGKGGVAGEVDDLRSDIEDGFTSLEGELAQGAVAVAQLVFAGQPSATDTLDIGADTYEFDGVGANINVPIAGSAELTLDNLVLAINGTTPAGESTENLLADKLGTTICRIRTATAPGGTVVGADPSIVLDASAMTNGSFDCGDVNMNTLGGVAAPSTAGYAVSILTITTAMITATTARVSFPFPVVAFTISAVDSGDIPHATWTADTVKIDNGDVLFGLGTDLANGDVVTVVGYA